MRVSDQYEIKEWNTQILKNFINNCYVVINDDLKTNEDCLNYVIKDNTLFAGGKNLNKDAMYSYELVFNEAFKKNGRITFTYRKDTKVKDEYINGQLNFYIDYDQKFHNVTGSDRTDIFTASFAVSEGHHSFMWQYNVWADPTDREEKEMAFELIGIKLEGLRQRQQVCQSLDGIISCGENSYFDVANVLNFNID